jgi:hypothetical protein
MFNVILIFGVVVFTLTSWSFYRSFKRYEKQFEGTAANSACVLNKKDIIEMLTPSMMFVLIAFVAFSIYFKSRHAADDIGSNQQLFEKFVQNVESGKQQITTDKAIAIIRSERTAVDSYCKAFAVEAWLIQWLAWISLLGILLQICIVFRVRKRNKMTDA